MLRKVSEHSDESSRLNGLVSSDLRRDDLSNKSSLRWRVSMLTAAMVAVAVGMMTIVAYWTVSSTLKSSVDADLDSRATALLQQSFDPSIIASANLKVDEFREYNFDTRVSLKPPGANYAVGDDLPQLPEEDINQYGYAVATINGERVLSKTNDIDATVVLSKDMTTTNQLITALGIVLLIVGFLGVLLAIGTGMVVSNSGLRPLAQLHLAVDNIRKTGDLKPIHVEGSDEIAYLAQSFNEMLVSLEDSRRKQADLVADAGHELKTPLTSMRANIELLMMIQNSGGNIPEEDRKALEHDVIAQMEEFSTLIGDLVDLARDEKDEVKLEPVDLVAIVEAALSRAERRRNDVEFTLESSPWYLQGDNHALERAMLNLMDNAAKWSPENGVVRIAMEPQFDGQMQITVSDSGPGIPEEDRELVFQRFFRSVATRSTPGSGLGLAIVQQTIHRHNGTITAEESNDGGAMMRVLLPGEALEID